MGLFKYTEDNLQREKKKWEDESEKRVLSHHADIIKYFTTIYDREEFLRHYVAYRAEAMKNWMKFVRSQEEEQGVSNNIEGLHRCLWEPLRKSGMEYTYNDNLDGSRQYSVKKCPFADMAKELGIQEEIFYYHCMSDHAIVANYNPDMEFSRDNTLMQGHDECNHRYKLKK